MSAKAELKRHTVHIMGDAVLMNKGLDSGLRGYRDVYVASEADALLVEKDARIEKLEGALQKIYDKATGPDAEYTCRPLILKHECKHALSKEPSHAE